MTLQELEIGSIVVDNDSMFNGEPIEWKVMAHGHSKYGADRAVLWSEKGLRPAYFDTPEPNSTITQAINYGLNNYATSNLRQWLNTEGENWFVPAHEVDAYTEKEGEEAYSCLHDVGFLSNLSEKMRAALMETSVQYLAGKESGAAFKESLDRVFLPSVIDLPDNDADNIVTALDERTPLPIFTDDEESRVCLNAGGETVQYWTRDATTSNDGAVYRVQVDCLLKVVGVNTIDIYVRPAICLSLDTTVEAGSDGKYVLVFSEPSPPKNLDPLDIIENLSNENINELSNKVDEVESRFTSQILKVTNGGTGVETVDELKDLVFSSTGFITDDMLSDDETMLKQVVDEHVSNHLQNHVRAFSTIYSESTSTNLIVARPERGLMPCIYWIWPQFTCGAGVTLTVEDAIEEGVSTTFNIYTNSGQLLQAGQMVERGVYLLFYRPGISADFVILNPETV